MEYVLRASAIALVTVVCALLIKSKNPELSHILVIAAVVLICLGAVSLLGGVAGFISDIIEKSGLSSAIFMPVIKCTGIAVVVKLVCDLCRDAGQSGAAAAVEYLGAAAAVCVALPLLNTFLNILGDLT